MDSESIRAYWNERALKDSGPQSTTSDFYLRDIEARTLADSINKYHPKRVIDLGCGDARTLCLLALQFPEIDFLGVDFSETMLINANKNMMALEVKNVTLTQGDVTETIRLADIGLAYTTRCLINLPTWDLQLTALNNITKLLANDGVYVMIENFVEGNESFNSLRRMFDLPDIPVRGHNLYFSKQLLLHATSDILIPIDEENISSIYYIFTRVLYSKICQDNGIPPDYLDKHHEYASRLPFLGKYGPVTKMTFKRKETNG